MSKSTKKAADQAEREKVHKRYSNRREPDIIYPARKQVDFYDADVHQRVAVYVRVSTDNLGQETSYELQKNYRDEQNRRKEQPANTVNGNQKSFGHLKGAKTIAR